MRRREQMTRSAYAGGRKGGAGVITFNIFSVKANGIDSSSSLNIGTNILIGFDSATKNVQGSGEVYGDGSSMPGLFSAIDDRDWVDSPAWQGGPPPWMTGMR